MIRRAYIFTGRVQRVGFRDRALHGAVSLGLTGWVRNEADGSVSMEVQGLEVSINKLLVYINTRAGILRSTGFGRRSFRLFRRKSIFVHIDRMGR